MNDSHGKKLNIDYLKQLVSKSQYGTAPATVKASDDGRKFDRVSIVKDKSKKIIQDF